MENLSPPGLSLSFHIMFAALSVVVPFFLLLSQGLYLKRKDRTYLALNKKWTTAFIITYAIGTVTGTVLTFGLGLFWPRFMDFAGPMTGISLSVEMMFFAGWPACSCPSRCVPRAWCTCQTAARG